MLFNYYLDNDSTEYSSFDKWEDGQFVEDNDMFYSLVSILAYFDTDNYYEDVFSDEDSYS